MRLPGTRYQEPGWEEVRKLLGQCSLAALRGWDPARLRDPDARAALLEDYVDAAGVHLHASRMGGRAQAAGNGYGDTVHELAAGLLLELRARAADWDAFCAAVAGESARDPAFWGPAGEGLLRKKVNDMYAQLRDKVDADNYQAACGRACSPNRMYAYRMLDTAYGELARLFAGWEQHRAQVGAILGRELAPGIAPIEVRQLRSVADCRPEWILRWSETLQDFGGAPGPLHTRSKRFASLKTSPDKIGAMLREIGEYEALSANQDRDWLQDLDDASVWMEDYWRVIQESQDAATPGPDRILEAAQDALDAAEPEPEEMPAPAQPAADPAWPALAAAVSLPPGFMEAAGAFAGGMGPVERLLAQDGVPVRLAVYAKLLGPDDESYPDGWRDPATGELPTMQQLAALAQVSLPTLRKRRDGAIARLQAALGRTMTGEEAVAHG
jgi:hypothetical protein